MGRFSRCSSLAREFSRLVVGPSAWGEPLGRFSSLGGFIPSFRRDPGRVITSKLGTSLFSVFCAVGAISRLGGAIGILEPLGTLVSTTGGGCELLAGVSGGLITPAISSCESACFRLCRLFCLDMVSCSYRVDPRSFTGEVKKCKVSYT
jgi:hypothetical protein